MILKSDNSLSGKWFFWKSWMNLGQCFSFKIKRLSLLEKLKILVFIIGSFLFNTSELNRFCVLEFSFASKALWANMEVVLKYLSERCVLLVRAFSCADSTGRRKLKPDVWERWDCKRGKLSNFHLTSVLHLQYH